MSTNKVLTDFASALLSGSIKIVDLTAPLGPNTPVLYLPPEIGKNTPAVKVHELSHYDQNGPFWAWNWLELGEHTGTHFDAPVHWITGKDYRDGTTDRIPVKNFVAPVCVIDRSKEAAKDPDYVLTPDSVKEWEREHGGIEAGQQQHPASSPPRETCVRQAASPVPAHATISGKHRASSSWRLMPFTVSGSVRLSGL